VPQKNSGIYTANEKWQYISPPPPNFAFPSLDPGRIPVPEIRIFERNPLELINSSAVFFGCEGCITLFFFEILLMDSI
jgi:hypothetical protein